MLNLKSDHEKEEMAKDVSAFANTKGGTIMVGKRDRSSVIEGLPEPLNAERIIESVSDRVYPPVRFSVHSHPWESRYVGIISIPQSKFVHELLRSGVTYVRRGKISDRARIAEIVRLKQEREHVSRTILLEPHLPQKIDNRIALFGPGNTHYVTAKKDGRLAALAECPVFLPTLTQHVSAPQFGEEKGSILTEYYSHGEIGHRKFLENVTEVQALVNRLGVYLDVDDSFYWSISSNGSFAFGSGTDTLGRAFDDGILGVVTLAMHGEFRGAFTDRAFILLVSGYCKYREKTTTWVKNPQIALYMSFIPVASDWIQTLLQPFLDVESPFSALSYELTQPQVRIWMPSDGYAAEVPIRGVARRYKYETTDRWTTVESVVADTDWYSDEGFTLDVDWDRGLDYPSRRNRAPIASARSTDPCPLTEVDKCFVSLSPPPDLEDIQAGKVKTFFPITIKTFEVGMGGHDVYVIGVNGTPSDTE
jgi:Schlafen, AlbA_2